MSFHLKNSLEEHAAGLPLLLTNALLATVQTNQNPTSITIAAMILKLLAPLQSIFTTEHLESLTSKILEIDKQARKQENTTSKKSA
jgi:hypothetical protein